MGTRKKSLISLILLQDFQLSNFKNNRPICIVLENPFVNLTEIIINKDAQKGVIMEGPSRKCFFKFVKFQATF